MSKKDDPTVLDGHSPVNQYRLLSLEKHASRLSEERMVLAFQALDHLIPHLGIYSPIFTSLREDFFDAVYSDQLTSTAGDKDSKPQKGFVQRVPYFTLVKHVHDARNVKTEELNAQLETVKERLFSKHKLLEDSQLRESELEQNSEQLLSTIDGLDHGVSEKQADVDRLEQMLRSEQEQAFEIQQQLQGDIADLRETLYEKQTEAEYLRQFKKGYDNLENAFQTQNFGSQPKKKKKAVISTKRANLISNIETAQKLEQQLLIVLNLTIEEFDCYMEGHKTELAEKILYDEMTELELEIQEREINQSDEELLVEQERFKKTISDLLTELELIRQHTVMLQEQLQILEESKPTLTKKREPKSKPAVQMSLDDDPMAMEKQDSVLSAGLIGADEEDDSSMDPFIPQERVFSKYAAMMYTSNNAGKTFHEFKEAKYCASCGEKTVICPHKLGGMEKVLILPHNCTHIKISRPKVRINLHMMSQLLKPPSPEMTLKPPSTGDSKGTTWTRGQEESMGAQTSPYLSTDLGEESIVTSTYSPDLLQESPQTGGGEGHMTHSLNRLWEDYNKRTSLNRAVPRPLNPARTVSLLEQFYAHILWQDESSMEGDACTSLLDSLYHFMWKRYLQEEVMYLATHDFLSAVIEQAPLNKTIQLLAHCLVGNLDGACIRYVLLLSDFIELVDWKYVQDFRAFAAVIYPSLQEDDLENLQMTYTSFSENKISKSLVVCFFIHYILKYRETRFQELEYRLMGCKAQEAGQMTEPEFKDALDTLLPLVSDKPRQRLYTEALLAVETEGYVDAVPVMRLSQISGYLGMLQISSVIRDTINEKVADQRDRPGSASSGRSHQSESDVADSILTMAAVKTLAANIARRDQHRLEAMEADGTSW